MSILWRRKGCLHYHNHTKEAHLGFALGEEPSFIAWELKGILFFTLIRTAKIRVTSRNRRNCFLLHLLISRPPSSINIEYAMIHSWGSTPSAGQPIASLVDRLFREWYFVQGKCSFRWSLWGHRAVLIDTKRPSNRCRRLWLLKLWALASITLLRRLPLQLSEQSAFGTIRRSKRCIALRLRPSGKEILLH